MSCIGIVGNDNVGNAIAFHFSNKGYNVKVLNVNEKGEYDGNLERRITRIRNIKGKFVEVSTEDKSIKWIESYEELSNVDFMIEAIHGTKEFKQMVLKKIENNSQRETPILTSGRVYFPSELATVLEKPSRLLGIYLYDIEHGNNNGEIVTHSECCEEVAEKIRTLFTEAGLRVGVVKECTGFVHNRIGLFGIMCLLKFYDEKIITLKDLSKYIVVTKVGPKLFFNLTLGKEAKFELIEAREVFIQLSEKLGNDKFRLPNYINKYDYNELTFDNILNVIQQDSVEDYSISDEGFQIKEFKKIHIKGIHPIYNNIIYPLLRGDTTLYFDENESKEYFENIKNTTKDLYDRVLSKTVFINEENVKEVDLVMDFTIEMLDEKIESCKILQQKFGTEIPILLNTPIHKLEDISKTLVKPSMVFGMYTQKAYLANTELIINDIMDKEIYVSIRRMIKKLASDYIETKDTYVRPLVYFVLAKLLEAARLLEDGIATMEDIEIVGVDGEIFKYMDLFGIKNISKICNYLKPIYGRTFSMPKILLDMEKDDKKFYR